MNISYILCLFLAVFSSACDDDKQMKTMRNK